MCVCICVCALCVRSFLCVCEYACVRVQVKQALRRGAVWVLHPDWLMYSRWALSRALEVKHSTVEYSTVQYSGI